MNEDQKEIQCMVLELLDAMRRYPLDPSQVANVTASLPGIVDGSFFERSAKDQKALEWLNGAFFGKGERGIPLMESGVLRGNFAQDFYDLLDKYWRSEIFPQRESTPLGMERVNRKLTESKVKAEKVSKIKKNEQVGRAGAEPAV